MKRVAQWGNEPAVGICSLESVLLFARDSCRHLFRSGKLCNTYQGRKLSDTLHHTPQDSTDDDVGKQKTSRTGFGVGRARSDEETGSDTTAETNHGDLVVAQAALGAAMATHVELGLQNGGLVVVVVVVVLGARLLNVADRIVVGGGPDGPGPGGIVRRHG